MGTRDRYEPGTFCWVDLDATDLDGATAFYERVFGWTLMDIDREDGHRLLELRGEEVAGMELLSDAQRADGIPTHWDTFVCVEEIDRACARTVELGGTVTHAAAEVGDAGFRARIADPQGAGLWLWQPDTFAGAGVVNEPGAWVWNDLLTTDPDAASTFYERLLGWEIAPAPGVEGDYRVIASGGRSQAGIMPLPEGVPVPAWTVYFGVASVEQATRAIAAAGGRTVGEPLAVGAGRVQPALDPFGASFVLMEGRFDD